MRFHVLAVPHTISNSDLEKYSACANTQQVIEFCNMMTKMGHHIIHYGHADSNLNCSEHVTVTTEEDLEYSYGNKDYRQELFDYNKTDLVYQNFYKNSIKEVRERAIKNDFLLCFMGTWHKTVADNVSDLPIHIVEPTICYEGSFAPYRVYMSYAWMNYQIGLMDANHRFFNTYSNHVEGIANIPSHNRNTFTNIRWTDTVIPNFFDPLKFKPIPIDKREGYHCFLGRVIWSKGLDIAMSVANDLNKKLVIAGQNFHNFENEYGFKPYGDIEFLGTIGSEKRKEVMANAEVGWMPTRYPECFGRVQAEFNLSDVGVVASDSGAFQENIIQGLNGYRCRSYDEFMFAAQNVKNLTPGACRKFAIQNFSVDRIAILYHEYFDKILRYAAKGYNLWMINNEDLKDIDFYKRNVPIKHTKEKLETLSNIDHDAVKYPTIETKPHISRLDDPKYIDYERTSKELAVSIPLFYSSVDSSNQAGFDVERFQDIHCKGAIIAGNTMLHNTDLAENGTPLFFHIEDKAYEYAKPVFDKAEVPEEYIKVLSSPQSSADSNIGVPHYGKTYIPLLDEDLDHDILMILDSDAFTLAEDTPIKLYDDLTQDKIKQHPTMTYCYLTQLEYQWYIRVCLNAVGLADELIDSDKSLRELEELCHKALGFTTTIFDDKKKWDKVDRYWGEDQMMTFPKDHPIREYIIQNIAQCHCTPYLHIIWGYHNQHFLNLNDLINLPIYFFESDFVKGDKGYNCLAHIQKDRDANESIIDQYYDDFYEHLTRNLK